MNNLQLETPRLTLIALSREQLRALLDEPTLLEKGMEINVSRDVLTKTARRAISIKLKRMQVAPLNEHAWFTYWLMLVKADQFGAGLIGYKGNPDASGEVEVGYGIDPLYSCQGFTTEALKALVVWAFNDPRCLTITAPKVLRSNKASIRILEKIGMEKYDENRESISWKITRKVFEMETQTLNAEEEIRATLQKFQDGYSQRDITQLDNFMTLFGKNSTLEVIGTSAVKTEDDEWCRSRKSIATLIENDWNFWGDVKLDVPGAHIGVRGSTAWLSTSGTVTRDIGSEQGHQNYLDTIHWIIENQKELSAEQKVLEILRGASNTLYECHKGTTYVWPMRFSAVLIRESDAQWRFQQVHFSFPTTRFPDVRWVETDKKRS